ncbi:MAG: hypothetical protein V3U26_04890 [Dehalococcoidia bacterium]
MFAFMLGFILGGVTGAAIVLAMSPSYQYQEEGEMPEDESHGAGAKAAEMGELVKARVMQAIEEARHLLHQAVEEGKAAAADRTVELQKLVKRHRGQDES